MLKNELLYTNSGCWQEELFDLASPTAKLISEEKRPSLCSLSSVCSESTIDLEHNETLYSINENSVQTAFDSILKENNFINKTEECYGSVYENTVADNTAGIEPMDNMNKFRKCMSLHDVSEIVPLQLTTKSANTVSSETIHSQSLSSTTKSKDSGFQRSVSCLSLTSGKRNYDHVQSKVKAYIQNIKESEALRKKNKLLHKPETVNEPIIPADEINTVLDKEDLILKIQELKHELHEKALYIDAQQKNYNSLLLKLAEAKNTIETLRLQRLSLDYTSCLEGTQNPLPSTVNSIDDFDIFLQKFNGNSPKTVPYNNNKPELKASKEVVISNKKMYSTKPPNCLLIDHFKPKTHSTPSKETPNKSLSPISKICCSSLRLDKNLKPLESLSKQGNQSRSSFTKSLRHRSTYPQYLRKSQGSSLKGSLMHTVSNHHIDLPNDDPFDKVKKWQASLPSINLLGTDSLSDCDMSETDLSQIDINWSGHVLPEKNQTEIKCLLSEELVTKCRISESELDTGSKNINCEPVKHVIRESLTILEFPGSRVTVNNALQDLKVTHNNSDSKSLSPGKNFHINGSQNSFIKSNTSSLFESKLVSNEICSKRKLIDLDSLDTQNFHSNPQTYLPKSSLKAHTDDERFNNNEVNSDDNSSNHSGSFVLPLSTERTKRRYSVDENKVSSKVPKLIGDKKTHSNFVLQKPKFNFTEPVKDPCKTEQSSNKKSNINTSVNVYFRWESSERKAWNARNNTSFYVCKDFHFEKSNSLLDSISVMEGMVERGVSIIKSALDRSNS